MLSLSLYGFLVCFLVFHYLSDYPFELAFSFVDIAVASVALFFSFLYNLPATNKHPSTYRRTIHTVVCVVFPVFPSFFYFVELSPLLALFGRKREQFSYLSYSHCACAYTCTVHIKYIFLASNVIYFFHLPGFEWIIIISSINQLIQSTVPVVD